jgi:hypothetical protein
MKMVLDDDAHVIENPYNIPLTEKDKIYYIKEELRGEGHLFR